ncbi:MAG TPA: lipoyl(octanoyl) transferase LipB [Terriglobales bacterium]|nr:lipoyl(octanoyl) transferase LipB [Terriglobales bacterium]
MISIVQLGLIDYATGLRLQERLVALRKEGQIGDVLLLLEHSPVITLGRNAKAHNVLVSASELAKRGVELFECDRGGDVTFHGPGQLVGYPIFDLRGFRSKEGRRATLGAVEFVRRLEEVLIRTCGQFGIATERVPGLTGVWTSAKEGCVQGKIAAIGVHISRGVTSHGFALNVNTELGQFNVIVPCGITSKPVTSMEKELGRQVSMSVVRDAVSRKFAEVFETEIQRVDSLDALMAAPADTPMKPPAELRRILGEEEVFWA